VAITVAIAVNFVAVVEKRYTNALGLLAVFPMALLLLTGLYLFVLPYAAKWRSGRQPAPSNSAVTETQGLSL
jgi:hypothetical protein